MHELLESIHPADRDRLVSAMKEHLETQSMLVEKLDHPGREKGHG